NLRVSSGQRGGHGRPEYAKQRKGIQMIRWSTASSTKVRAEVRRIGLGGPSDRHLARAAGMTFEPIMANSSQAMPWVKGMNSGGSTYIWPGLPKAIQPGTSLSQEPQLTR